jgi:hypothetical protein
MTQSQQSPKQKEQTDMTLEEELIRYAAIFAADADTDALYHGRYTDGVAELCVNVAEAAILRREAAKEAGEDFYACAFVEQAAHELNHNHAATLEQLIDAGQRESDSLARRGA